MNSNSKPRWLSRLPSSWMRQDKKMNLWITSHRSIPCQKEWCRQWRTGMGRKSRTDFMNSIRSSSMSRRTRRNKWTKRPRKMQNLKYSKPNLCSSAWAQWIANPQRRDWSAFRKDMKARSCNWRRSIQRSILSSPLFMRAPSTIRGIRTDLLKCCISHSKNRYYKWATRMNRPHLSHSWIRKL